MSSLTIIDCEQNTLEWVAARVGKVTSSAIAEVMRKGRGSAPSKTRRTYMYKLIGERMTGDPMDSYSNAHMERGKDMEDEAIALYSMMEGVTVERIGFCHRAATEFTDEEIGASPDGFVGERGGVQIKTALPHIQIDRILGAREGKVPPEHIPQLQGELWITKRDWIDFVSYWPMLPMAKVRVFRDEAYIARIKESVQTFIGELRTVMDAVTEAP